MLLTYKDLSKLFPHTSGIKDNNLSFQTISSSAHIYQPKGVFIPLCNASGELQEAIANGAVAAIWKKGKEIPKYTPNHFPIFYCEDLLKGLKEMLLLYREKLQEMDNMEKTNFLFLDEKLLNEYYETYDIAVIEDKLNKILVHLKGEGEL